MGAVIRWAEFDPATGELPVAAVQAVLSPRTRCFCRSLPYLRGGESCGGVPRSRLYTEAAHLIHQGKKVGQVLKR